MKIRILCCIPILLMSCGGSLSERLILVPNKADLNASLREHIKTFEEVCIPFAIHETRLSLKEDMKLNTRQMEGRDYQRYSRPRNCMSATDTMWHPTQEYKSSVSNDTFEMIWPQKRNRHHFPGGSCAYTFDTPEGSIDKLLEAFQTDDSRWVDPELRRKQNTPATSESVDKKPKQDQKFTVFDGVSETTYWGASGQQFQKKIELFDEPSGLTFSLRRVIKHDEKAGTQTYQGVRLKVKGENHDGQWAPFMPINCP